MGLRTSLKLVLLVICLGVVASTRCSSPSPSPRALFVVDVLPHGAAIHVEGQRNPDSMRTVAVRFQAEDAQGHLSAWTAWYPYHGAPIHLRWLALWSTPT